MNILETIKELISVQFETDYEKISEDTTWEELGADSLDVVDLVSELEGEYEIDVDEEIIEKLKNVGDIVKLFEETV